jgi:sodium/pantothenate symporter
LLAGIGLKHFKQKISVSEYLLLDGKLSLGPFVSTMVSTNLSLGNLIYVSAIWGFSYGGSSILWLCIALIVFVVAFKHYAPYIKHYIEDKNNCGTLHEFLSISFLKDNKPSVSVRLVASLSTIISLLIALVLELHLGAQIFSAILGVNVFNVFLAFTAIISIYTALGGYRSVILTDIVQAVLMVFGLFILLYIFFSGGSYSWTSYEASFGKGLTPIFFGVGWQNIISILTLGVGWFLVSMDAWQRNCASRSVDTSVKGLTIGAFGMGIFIVAWAVSGLYVHLAVVPGLSEEQLGNFSKGYNPIGDLLLFQSQLGGLWPLLIGILAFSLVMAALSSADTFLVVCGHSFISDLIVGVGRKSNFGNLTGNISFALSNIARGVIVSMTIVLILLWALLNQLHLLQDPLTLFFIAYSVQWALLAPIIFGAIKKKRSANIVFLSIIAGIVTALFVGFGSAFTLYAGQETILGLSTLGWLALTPFVTFLVSFSIIAIPVKG